MSRTSVRGGRLRRPRAAAGATVTVLVAALSACSGADPVRPGAQPSATPSVSVLPVPTRKVAATVLEVADVFRPAVDGTALPDPGRTPGSVFLDVPQEVVCGGDYPGSVHRPKFNDKVEAFAGYALSIHERDQYAVDHLVPTGLGGSNDPENLWPQPRRGPMAVAEKDRLEAHLRVLVCSGTIPLAEAQRAVAQDWRAAFDRYVDAPVVPGAAPPPTAPHRRDVLDEGSPVGPCPGADLVGRTRLDGIRYTCAEGGDGQLSWQKRF